MRACAAVLAFVVLLLSGWPVAARQTPAAVPRALMGIWRLVSLERADASQPLATVPNPIGILIHDAKGNVIEIVTRAGRAASIDVLEQFMTYQAFWGRFSSAAGQPTITYRINGDLDPRRTGQEIVRSYDRNGERRNRQLASAELRADRCRVRFAEPGLRTYGGFGEYIGRVPRIRRAGSANP